MRKIRLLFSGSGPDLRFVEAEDSQGRGVSIGEWTTEDSNGHTYQVLNLTVAIEEPKKIIQIAHAPASNFGAGGLFGLDDNGSVWWMQDGRAGKGWEPHGPVGGAL